jgi:hypothetical protein
MLAGAEVEHLDGMVDFGGNEKMVALQIDGEVIEVPGNVWQSSHVHESDGLEWHLFSRESEICSKSERAEEKG